MKKSMSSVVLLSLAVLLCCSSPLVGLVSANFLPAPVPEHSIEITADGDVTGTNKIQRSGNVYTFTGDIEGSIVIFRSGIVVDGAGYTLQGDGSLTGVWLQGKSDVTLKNMQIRGFRVGIELTFGFATGTSSGGCVDITVSGNTIADNEYGIRFSMFSSNNSALGNTIENNTYGICINYSPDNVFRNNQLRQNKYNLWVNSELSSSASEFVNDIDASNTVDGKPIIYWINEQNKAVPLDAGYVALVKCRNITVQNLVLINNGQGVLLVGTDDSLIESNYIGDNYFGIVFQGSFAHCYDNVISKNNFTRSDDFAIYSWGSYNTVITGNSIKGVISFYESPNAYIVGNALSGNVHIKDSENSTVDQNDIEVPDHEIPDKIPEFPSWTPLLIMVVTVIAVAVVYRRSMSRCS